MNLCMFEDGGAADLYPLTLTRATFELRTGRYSLAERAARILGRKSARLLVRAGVRDVVEARAEMAVAGSGDWLLLNGRALVTVPVIAPERGWAWVSEGRLTGAVLDEEAFRAFEAAYAEAARSEDWRQAVDGVVGGLAKRLRAAAMPDGVRLIRYPWDLVGANGELLRGSGESRGDCDRTGLQGTIHDGVYFVNRDRVSVAAGAVVKPGVVLDASEGPIHIDTGTIVEPNSAIQGPCFIGPECRVQPGASIRHETSIGAVCKVGGEIEASIIHGYSNKQHDGFLGHSYVGAWVNLGADTVTSDLKNTYGPIRVAVNGVEVDSGQMFVGSTIGDHAKTGIGTILPTGCVIGTASNVFCSGSVPKFVPSFSWLTGEAMTEFRLMKALEIARTVMGRRKVTLTETDARNLRWAALEAGRMEVRSARSS